MTSSAIKRTLGIAGGLLMVSFFGLGAVSQATTYPYLQAKGSDVFAGGWFNSTPDHCSDNYQSYNHASFGQTVDPKNGGILTYATTDGSGNLTGASGQYGAFALGSIEGVPASNYGFYSGAPSGSVNDKLSFANSGLPSGGNAWGGQFEGGGTAHCVPDYFGTKQTNTTALANTSTLADVNSLASGNYTVNAGSGNYNISGGAVDSGKNIALFITGNVYISGNVTYALHNPTNVPKFALVVQGNIYTAPGVSRLDGWYIAQPGSSGTLATNDGIIWTCHNITNSQVIDSGFLNASCNNSLVVNGALVAKQVNFTRIAGNIGSGTVAETINYTPDMIIGGPFFNASSSYTLDSLVSLPPVF